MIHKLRKKVTGLALVELTAACILSVGLVVGIYMVVTHPAFGGEMVQAQDGDIYYLSPENGPNCVIAMGRPNPAIDFPASILMGDMLSGKITINEFLDAMTVLVQRQFSPALRNAFRDGMVEVCGLEPGDRDVPGSDS